MINTRKVADRRRLRFSNLQEVLADVERLDAVGGRRTTGNWSDAQIVQHVARMVNLSLDGFPGRAPLALRMVGKLMRQSALTKTLQPGFRFPARFAVLAPDPDVTWDRAVDDLREAVGRFRAQPEVFPSPVLGPLSHEEWEQLHCRHAELHLSFMHPAADGSG